jgi:hypothetical protein
VEAFNRSNNLQGDPFLTLTPKKLPLWLVNLTETAATLVLHSDIQSICKLCLCSNGYTSRLLVL